MSDIRANLAGTASFGLRTATDRSIATPADALSFVHNQVAGALMGRRLIFCVDDVPRLYCDVARCRLMRFTVLCPNEAIIAEEYFDDMSNSEQVKAKLNTLAYSILEFCEAGALIAVQPQPLLDAADPTHGGVAASSLAVAFGLESDMRATWTPVEALNTFLTEAGTAVIASAHMNEDLLYPITGEDEHIDILAAKLEWILDDLDGDQKRDADCASRRGPSVFRLWSGRCASYRGCQCRRVPDVRLDPAGGSAVTGKYLAGAPDSSLRRAIERLSESSAVVCTHRVVQFEC